MFLPISDSPNPKGFIPYVTWGVIACNIAVYLFINIPQSSQAVNFASPWLNEYVQFLLRLGVHASDMERVLMQLPNLEVILFHFGFKPGAPDIISLFTGLFLHSGFMHLFGNMLFLYIYGDNVERQLGRIKFLLMYLFAGIIATMSFAVFAGSSMRPLVGASGAISGVLGCYFLMFPKNKIKVFLLFFPFFVNVIEIPARIVLGIYVLIDNIFPLLVHSGGNVAHGAHLGGFFCGLAVAFLGEKFNWQMVKQKGETFQEERVKDDFAIFAKLPFDEQIDRAISQDSAGFLDRVLQKKSRDEISTLAGVELLRVIRFLRRHNFLDSAAKLCKTGITAHKNSDKLAEFYYELGQNRVKQGLDTAAYQHFLTALDHYPSPETERRIRSALSAIQKNNTR